MEHQHRRTLAKGLVVNPDPIEADPIAAVRLAGDCPPNTKAEVAGLREIGGQPGDRAGCDRRTDDDPTPWVRFPLAAAPFR